MRRIALTFCTAFLGVILVQAANPEATVSSDSPFRLRGAVVPVAGVPAWPLLVGDVISTDASTAAIRFSDGSSVVLAKKSSARLEQQDGNLVFLLLTGAIRPTPAAGSHVGFQTSAAAAKGNKAARTLSKPPPPPPPQQITAR